MKKIRTVPALLVSLAVLAVVVAVSIFIGPAMLTPREAWDGLLGRGEPRFVSIVRDTRLPRALLAALCGAALSGAGVVFQGLFRNPLADPFVMGVSGGAGLGAVIVVSSGVASLWGMAGAAFVGGLGAAWAAYLLARVRGRTPIATLVLAGFAVGAFCSALLAMVAMVNTHDWDEVLRWLFGRCAHPDPWKPLGVAAPLVAVGLVAVAFRTRELNVLTMGEESAQQLGVEVERAKLALLAAGTVLTAAAVSVCGIVGFVGLIVPHAARALVGPDHRRLLPVAVVAGAAALAAADTLARSVLPPHELPLGAVTAVLGAPFFAVLLRRRV
jgi:iron complex transport system permease protein